MSMVNKAMELITVRKPKCIVFQRENVWVEPLKDCQVDWNEAIKKAKPHECVPVEANEPLYVLCTSGTTGTHTLCPIPNVTPSKDKLN